MHYSDPASHFTLSSFVPLHVCPLARTNLCVLWAYTCVGGCERELQTQDCDFYVCVCLCAASVSLRGEAGRRRSRDKSGTTHSTECRSGGVACFNWSGERKGSVWAGKEVVEKTRKTRFSNLSSGVFLIFFLLCTVSFFFFLQSPAFFLSFSSLKGTSYLLPDIN